MHLSGDLAGNPTSVRRIQMPRDLEQVRCPDCGQVIGLTGYLPGTADLEHSLYLMQLDHKCPSPGGEKVSREGTSRAKKAKAMAQEPVPQPEAQPEVVETNADVIVAQRLEAESEARRGDSEEQTPMEILAGVAPRKGRLQKGDYPVWLQKINAERLEARNKRVAEKAAAKEAAKAEKEAAKAAK